MATYVFVSNHDRWDLEATLIAPDAVSSDDFGRSVYFHQDRLVVGSSGSGSRRRRAGAAYVYRLIDEQWRFEAKLVPDDPQKADYLGASVSIHGETAVAGAISHHEGKKEVGAVYTFDAPKCSIGPCTGSEKFKKAKCRKKSSNTLKVVLLRGVPGDFFNVETPTRWGVGTIGENGKAKVKITYVPGGEGTAKATWFCGAVHTRKYECPE